MVNPSSGDDSGSDVAVIVGATVGVVAVLALLGGGTYAYKSRKEKEVE